MPACIPLQPGMILFNHACYSGSSVMETHTHVPLAACTYLHTWFLNLSCLWTPHCRCFINFCLHAICTVLSEEGICAALFRHPATTLYAFAAYILQLKFFFFCTAEGTISCVHAFSHCVACLYHHLIILPHLHVVSGRGPVVVTDRPATTVPWR